MYGFSWKSAAELARAQEPAPRILSPGPTIAGLLAKDAEVIDPYEQETRHVDYLNIRATSKSGWDICSICYFEDFKPKEVKKKNLNKHIGKKHNGQTRESCRMCTAMFLTRHLKWHTKYCHPGIAVK